jgi:hypothetical protein
MRVAVACVALGFTLSAPGALGGARTGWLDRTFGEKGIVRPTFSGKDLPAGVAVQSDRKIVVAATADFAVARYFRNGKLDQSFGSAGKLLVDLGSLVFDEAVAVALQADGKIVVGG